MSKRKYNYGGYEYSYYIKTKDFVKGDVLTGVPIFGEIKIGVEYEISATDVSAFKKIPTIQVIKKEKEVK